MGVGSADEQLQADGLGAVDDGHDDLAFLMGEAAPAFHDGGAVVQVFHNEFADGVGIVGNDLEHLVGAQVIHHRVHHIGFHEQPEQGKEARFHAEGEACAQGHDQIGHGQGHADVHMGVFFHQHGDNVRTAGRSVHVEQDGRAHGGQAHGENQFQHRLAGHGRGHGHQLFQQQRQARGYQRGISRFRPEAFAQESRADDQKYHVQDHIQRGGGHRGDIVGH